MGDFVTNPVADSIETKEKLPGRQDLPTAWTKYFYLATEFNKLKQWALDIRTYLRGREFNVKNYGAVSDGVTNDAAAVQAALTAAGAAGRGVVTLPQGTTKCNAALVLPSGVQLVGAGRHSSVLDLSGANPVDNVTLSATGSLVALPALSVAPAKDALTLTFATAPSVAAGDVLRLYDTTDFSYSAHRAYYRAGEFARVLSVASTVVTLDAPLFSAYPSTISVHRMVPCKVGVSGLTLALPTSVTGLKVTYGYGVRISDVEASGTDISHITLSNCFDSVVDGVHVADAHAASTTSYGITVANSQRIIVSNSVLTTARHALAVGGDSGPVNRHLLFVGNVLSTTGESYAADMHGNAENCTYRGNVFNGGATLSGDFNSYVDNDIRALPSTGVGVYVSEGTGPNHTLQGNRIWATAGNVASTSALISFGLNTNGTQYLVRGGTFRVVGNEMRFGAHLVPGIIVFNSNNAVQPIDVEVVGNRLLADAVAYGTTRNGIILKGATGFALRNCRVKNNALDWCGIRIEVVQSLLVEVDGNVLNAPPREGIYVAPAAAYGPSQTRNRVLCTGNRVLEAGRTGIRLQGDGDGTLSMLVAEDNFCINTCQGGTTGSTSTDSSLYLKTAALALVRNNTWGEEVGNPGGQQRCAYYEAVTELRERDNENVGTLISASLSVTTRISGYTHDATLREAWGTAAPTTGTWKVGDRVWNSTPAAAGTPGWECTTAGTPGTWKAMAVLAA